MDDFANQHTIEVMINRRFKGKLPADGNWGAFHRGFRLERVSPRQLAIAVWRGYAFCPVYNGRRRKENFSAAWHIALDFDTGDERSSLDYLAEQDLINLWASFGYTTPSHTDEKPKARIVWIFPYPIVRRQQYTNLYLALLHNFPWADQSTKDPVRLFFGSEGCAVWDNWSIMPLESANQIYEDYLESQPPPPKPVRTIAKSKNELSEKFLTVAADNLLDNVRQATNGEKHNTLNRIAYTFGGYVAGGYYDRGQVEGWLESAIASLPNVKSMEAARQTVAAGIEAGMSKPLHFEVKQAPTPKEMFR